MKKILTLLLCSGLFVYTGCNKKTQTINDPAPCDIKTWYQDSDGDGLGNPNAETIKDCDQPAGYVLNSDDPIDLKVQQKQVPILVKFTGETCPPCGGWGWTAWESLSSKFWGTGFCWSNYGDGFSNNHFRSQELNPTMDSIEDRFFSGGKPSFFANNKDFDQSEAAAEAEATNSLTAVPYVAAVLEPKIEGDQLTITSEIEFFQDVPGSYYVGAYLVEDKPVAYQAGNAAGNNAEHHFVMRGSLSPGAWGEEIVSSSAKAGDKFLKTFTATIPPTYNKDNFSYGIIIWRKIGLYHIYVNAYTTQGL
jgi:hypothetical protein